MKHKIIIIGLAMNVFQVCRVNQHTKTQFSKKLMRNDLLNSMRQQSPTVWDIEACYSSYY